MQNNSEKKNSDSVLLQKLKKIFSGSALSGSTFSGTIQEISEPLGESCLVVANKNLFTTLQELKNNPELHFEQMMDLTAVDYLNHDKPSRFQIVYHLLSLQHQFRLRVKCHLVDGEKVESITSLWDAADWYERECYDMYGIIFQGHPNLKRILLYEEFEGHPLRKDYSITKEQPLIPVKEIVERQPYMQKLDI